VHPYQGSSMFLVPKDLPGIRIVRNVGTMEDPEHPLELPGGHAEIYYEDVRLPADALLGDEGQGFVLAQKRLVPGRLHHVMRWVGVSNRAYRMLCERAVSRVAFGEPLARKQFVQEWVATCGAEIQALKLMTLNAAWKFDKYGSSAARTDVSLIKFFGSNVLFNAIDRAIQVHGALGFTTDMPLERMYRAARAARFYDGPDEVHKQTVARQILKGYEPVETPTEHIPTRRAAAIRKFGELLEEATVNA
jgi:acyl-CoA dehydrogenase